MFSRRSFVPPGDNELSLLHKKAKAPWLDLSSANPTRAGLERPDFAALLGRHEASYEPAARGLRVARESLVALYTERGVELREEDLLVCASTSEAYAYLLMTLCDPGDAIAIPEPSYPLFSHLAQLHSVEVRTYRLGYDGAWYIDFESLGGALDDRTRAIFVVSPNNPTGSFLKPHELHRLWQVGLPLVVDEVFRPYPWSTFRGSIADPLVDPPVLTCVLDGLSKRIGAPELKLAWMAWAGPARQMALGRLECIADTFLSVAGPVQRALPELLAAGEPFQRALMARIERNLASLREVTVASAVTLLEGEGGWYAVLRFPAVHDEQGWLERLLLEDRLGPHPGWLFDFEQGPVFVVSLLLPEETFADAAVRLVQRVEKECPSR